MSDKEELIDKIDELTDKIDRLEDEANALAVQGGATYNQCLRDKDDLQVMREELQSIVDNTNTESRKRQ